MASLDPIEEPDVESIAYSDGVEIEAEIARIIGEAPHVTSSTPIAWQRYGDWPIRYHLCPERSSLFRHLDFKGLDVLELGAGLGGASRYLAEEAQTLTVVEGTHARFAALQARLRDLDNWTGEVANLQDYRPGRLFDVVCLIGVLEYSELYVNGEKPFHTVLQHAHSLLKPGGILLVAIENRFGLKYWGGAPEDHTTCLFDGICGYPTDPTPRTFGRNELKRMLGVAGYEHTDCFYPWPDYKTPIVVLSERAASQYGALAADLVFGALRRDAPLYQGMFPEMLTLQGLGDEGLLEDSANSFLFAAQSKGKSDIRDRLLRRLNHGEIAWHYAIRRKNPETTRFLESEAGLLVEKADLTTGVTRPGDAMLSGERLILPLCRHAYFGEVDKFQTLLVNFLNWSMERWSIGEGKWNSQATDAILTNTFVDAGEYKQFDLELSDTSITASRFVLRNVLVSHSALSMFPASPWSTLEALYEWLCLKMKLLPNIEADLRAEAALHAEISAETTAAEAYAGFCVAVHAPVNDGAFPRGMAYRTLRKEMDHAQAIIADLNLALDAHKLEIQRVHGETTRGSVRVALKLERGIKKVPGLYSLLRALLRPFRGKR